MLLCFGYSGLALSVKQSSELAHPAAERKSRASARARARIAPRDERQAELLKKHELRQY